MESAVYRELGGHSRSAWARAVFLASPSAVCAMPSYGIPAIVIVLGRLVWSLRKRLCQNGRLTSIRLRSGHGTLFLEQAESIIICARRRKFPRFIDINSRAPNCIIQ
jgi:hypothetical protein